MGQGIRKKSGPVSIIEFEDEEPSIDDLLGNIPEKLKVIKETIDRKPRVTKGLMVTFLTKQNKRITAPGVLYYVTRFNGRLHYKEASQVTLLPDDWEEGDDI